MVSGALQETMYKIADLVSYGAPVNYLRARLCKTNKHVRACGSSGNEAAIAKGAQTGAPNVKHERTKTSNITSLVQTVYH